VYNHTLVMGTVSVAVLIWWLLLARRSAVDARDPGFVHVSTAPFLRLAFVMVMYAAAFAKLNTGFFDPITTCAVWILDSIPVFTTPPALAGVAIAGAIFTEFAIPTLLLFRRTRFLGVIAGIGFGVVTAVAGHAPFAGFAWSFYLLFIPPTTLGRVAVTVRRAISPTALARLKGIAAAPVGWIVLTGVAFLVMAAFQVAPEAIVHRIRPYGAMLAFCTYVLVWTLLLLKNWRHWLRVPPRGRGTIGIGHVVFAATVIVIIVNAASPYVGLKTRYSFTMFSNLQTEPGRWNHMIVPETARIFDLQEGAVDFDEISDPALAAKVDVYSGPSRWSAASEKWDTARVVLLAAQRLATHHPDATVRYRLDGQPLLASPVASDRVLGAPVPLLVQILGGFRPLENEDSCQL